eukprot:s847_g2.t1
MESDEPKPKGKKKKAERDRTPPQDFSDMDSEEFQSRTKKGKKGKAPPPSGDSSGSGKRKKVRRKKSADASEEDRGRKKGKDWIFSCCRETRLAQPSSTPSAVLLTTHSMEEAEALSSRLGIMAEGQLLTVGTAQQIKEKHGSSQELVLRLRPERNFTELSKEALGQVMRDMGSELEASSVMAMLESTPWRRAAYYRPRCIVRLQLEQRGCVEASVLAEWWLQQAKGHAIEEFLQSLAGDRVELAEDFGLYWRFRLPRSGLSLPQLFRQLEDGPDLDFRFDPERRTRPAWAWTSTPCPKQRWSRFSIASPKVWTLLLPRPPEHWAGHSLCMPGDRWNFISNILALHPTPVSPDPLSTAGEYFSARVSIFVNKKVLISV